MAYDDVLSDLADRLEAAIEATPIDRDPDPVLYRALAEINQALSAGGGGGGITQAQVKAAIESADNLTQPIGVADGWRSLTLSNADSSYAATSTGFEFTVPTDKEWQFQSAYIPYAAGATAANRVLRVFASASAGFITISASRVTQTANQTRYYNVGLFPSLDAAIDSQFICVPMPPLILGVGDKIGVTVPALPSGDSLSNPIVKVMERSV